METNYFEAAKWYRKAAEQNYADAQSKLGMCYFRGLGVPQSFVEAVKWFQKAADQDNLLAQCQLGDCYANGKGVPQDSAEAIKWYLKAANQNFSPAQFVLSGCYKKGDLVEKNMMEYYKWECLAAYRIKGRDMKIVLDEIASGLTPDQLAQAQKEISEFQTSLHNRPALVITDGRVGDWGE
jgi:hypothetical protein